MLIDTHCHLNDPAFSTSLIDVLERSREAGVVAFIVPSYDRESLKTTEKLASDYKDLVYPAYGIHPWLVDKHGNLDILRLYIRHKDTVAVGEIGLDFAPDTPPQNLQIDAFSRQLDFARESGLPVLIHCRRAHETMYQIVKTYYGRIRGVMHSFSGDIEMMNRFLDLGFYISFSGSVTRETAKKYHNNAQVVPLDRLLVETDAPSIATKTTIASGVEPRHAVEVTHKIAELRGISYEEVCTHTTNNAKHLFNLP
jgi:TatD DNase family protein